MIFAVPEEVSAQTKTSIEHTLKFAETTAETAEQLFELNIKTVKAASGDAVKQIKALAGAKDIQELTALQTSFAQANAEKVAGYSRAIYGWATEAQSEVSKLVETQIAEINKSFSAALDKVAKSAPSGSEFAFAAVKSAMTTANQAFDALTKAGKQVADITEATLNAAPAAPRKKAA